MIIYIYYISYDSEVKRFELPYQIKEGFSINSRGQVVGVECIGSYEM